jgi:hypothetical protein
MAAIERQGSERPVGQWFNPKARHRLAHVGRGNRLYGLCPITAPCKEKAAGKA